ncbi:hypothetical protein Tco_0794137 [Tanacetum coccineum]
MKVGRRWWVEGGEEWRLLVGYDGRRAAVGGDDGVTMVLKWVGGRWRGGDGDGGSHGGGSGVNGWWSTTARGLGDRIDRLIRNVFSFGRKARRKSFPVAATGGRRRHGGRRWVAGY